MDFASLPQHPASPMDIPGRGVPERDWSVVCLRVGMLAVLLAVVGFFGYYWWVLFQIFGDGGFREGTFFA